MLRALFSFRAKNTDRVWRSREQLAKRCGMHASNISAATSALVRLGWLRKEGKGGWSKTTRYQIIVPESLTPFTPEAPAQETLAEEATVVDLATRSVAHPATQTVAHSAIRIEQTKEQTKPRAKLALSDWLPHQSWA